METALKYVFVILLLIVATVVIIGLLSMWTGQSSDMATGIVNFFKGLSPGDLNKLFEKGDEGGQQGQNQPILPNPSPPP